MYYDRVDRLDTDTGAVRDATIAVVGAGATGSRMLEQLAGLGCDLHIVDRDYLERPNLATSALYTAEDVEEGLPKAVAAAQRLAATTPEIEVDAAVADVNHRTVDEHLAGADLVLDGTDNITTRQLINEWSCAQDVPWVHVAALGRRGTAMPVVPGETACFRCAVGDVDGAALPTCETAGISPAAAGAAASLGVAAAIDILAGDVDGGMARVDLAADRSRTLDVARRPDCPVCGEGERPHLSGAAGTGTTQVCGEDQYQVRPESGAVDLDALAAELEGLGAVTQNEHLLRFDGGEQFTVFRDGRMLVEADSPEQAKQVYARFVGA
ncbi:MAG: ThiF family adenylyltransferase [Candidatus Nanohaloarchaea archaeon]|nr:ThiF family adenylyltransferase [Candidatus Nanohaloarchaea archaeon]